GDVAAARAEKGDLLLRLHALGDHLDAQAARQRNGAADDGGIVRADGNVMHEGAVDLELADGKALEIGKRGKAGAEIVDRDAHAQAVHAAQQAGDMVDIVHGGSFGQLDLEQFRTDAGKTYGV